MTLRCGIHLRAVAPLVVLCVLGVSRVWAAPPQFDFKPPATAGDPQAPEIMRDLAARLVPVYEEADRDRYLATLSALQMVAGDYVAADASRQSLRERETGPDASRPLGRVVIFDLYAHAKAMESEQKIPFAEGFAQAFRDTVPRLGDQDAYAVSRWLALSASVFRGDLQKSFDRQRPQDAIGQAEAVDLIWKYLTFDAYRNFGPLIDALAAEDDARRYVSSTNVMIRSRHGGTLSAVIIRPKQASAPLPALLEFTLRDSPSSAKEAAAHGYAGVVAFALGTGRRRTLIPYEHAGDDARAVIKWIAAQSWSDGRVGMYGEGYSGFTPWAAAKHMPAALKAIATSVASAPGINVPMQGSIYQNSAFRWALRASASQALDDKGFADGARWRALNESWYRSGKRYRDLGRVYGVPNPLFIRWLNHPSYDHFWQKMLPYRKEFSRIKIPVLTMTGYFAAAEPGDLYYFAQHLHYDANADHTLLIGPYDDGMMLRGQATTLHGYAVDAAAIVDLHELRYRWFDHVLKDAAQPALLADRVNYQVMGTNEWRHVAGLDAMANGSMRFFVHGADSAGGQQLSQEASSKAVYLAQTVNLVDRDDANWSPGMEVVAKSVDARYATVFSSEPLTEPIDFHGVISGKLDVRVNKMDMDVSLAAYELLADGSYLRLFAPTEEFRASYVHDRGHRRLLHAGVRQQIAFRGERLISRRFQSGSRLVLVLGISKRPDREINYGTGNDVSEESSAGGKVPLKVEWYADSYVDMPVRGSD